MDFSIELKSHHWKGDNKFSLLKQRCSNGLIIWWKTYFKNVKNIKC